MFYIVFTMLAELWFKLQVHTTAYVVSDTLFCQFDKKNYIKQLKLMSHNKVYTELQNNIK
jgi:hypothetical protein